MLKLAAESRSVHVGLVARSVPDLLVDHELVRHCRQGLDSSDLDSNGL